ncbi:MAG TPA: hypothetical protein VLI94_12165 [Solirubrobacterales bacterium]|nr:hypothetical protein [Solirubrobacterales bacterium]
MGLITGFFGRRAHREHLQGLDLLLEEPGANSLGVESAGPWQVRGNGNLALTADELLFAQWVPKRLLRIPRSSIVEVSKAKTHLGKWIGRPLLKVAWTRDDGEQDSIALWVRDLDRWLAELTV